MRSRAAWTAVALVAVGSGPRTNGGVHYNRAVSVAAVGDSLPPATYETFGLALLRTVAAHGTGNVFLSPVSAGLALAMTATGARGRTFVEMSRVLGLDPSVSTVAMRNHELMAALVPQDGIELTVANALWARPGVEFASEFLDRDRDSFGARVTTVDMSTAAGIATINEWVRSATMGKISTIFDTPLSSGVLVLTNAVYFKG